MITALISLLILALVLWVLFLLISKFFPEAPLDIVRWILGLIVLLYAVRLIWGIVI